MTFYIHSHPKPRPPLLTVTAQLSPFQLQVFIDGSSIAGKPTDSWMQLVWSGRCGKHVGK
jgi:hypothetical protein